MPLLPDLSVAAIYAVVVFLLALGFLVVFIETISTRRLAGSLIVLVVIAAGLAWIGEGGIALLVIGLGAALLANHAFEWLTTR